jgi:hypothetical protein
MRSASWWLEWPAGLVRIGVVFLVATAALAALVRYPGLLRELGSDALRNAALSYSDREIAGGNGLVADQGAVYAARGLIPRDASYDVAVGSEFEGGSDLTKDYVASYYRYFLLPRRPRERAPWVVCYGCDLAEYGSSAKVLWEDRYGISIVRVAP